MARSGSATGSSCSAPRAVAAPTSARSLATPSPPGGSAGRSSPVREKPDLSWARRTSESLLSPLGRRWAHTLGVVERTCSFAGVRADGRGRRPRGGRVPTRHRLRARVRPHRIPLHGRSPLLAPPWLRAHYLSRRVPLRSANRGVLALPPRAASGVCGGALHSTVAQALTYCDLTLTRTGGESPRPRRERGSRGACQVG